MNIRTFIGIGSLMLMATLGAGGVQADATPVQDAGVWRVYALRDDNGKFLACKANMPQNDQGLEIAAGPNDSFYLWLSDASWHFGTDPIPDCVESTSGPVYSPKTLGGRSSAKHVCHVCPAFAR